MEKLKQEALPWLFLVPSLAGTAVFMGFPFLDAVRRSFQDAMGVRFTGLKNYRAVWNNEAFRLAAGNTARFLALCIPLLMAVSLGLALVITWRRKGAGNLRLVRTTLVLPMVVPAAAMVLIWRILLCPDGILNQALTVVTGRLWETDWAFSGHSFSVLIATYLWKHTGYDMILWLAGLSGIPEELYEAARIDGAGLRQELIYITFPQLGGTAGLVGILSVVNSFRVYREAYLLAGSYQDSSIYLIPHLFAHWFLNLDIQKMTAAAVMMTAVFLLPVAAWKVTGGRRP